MAVGFASLVDSVPDVPYGQDVPRWADPKPLADGHRYPGKEYTVDGLYCAQPSRSYTLQSMYSLNS